MKNRAGIKDIIGLLKCKNQDESEKNSNRLSSLKEIEQLKMANKKRIENTSSHLEIRDLLCKMGQRPNPLYYLLPELPLKSPINVSIHSKANLSAEKPKPPRKPQKKLTLDLKSIESLDDLNSYFKSVTSRFKPSEKDFSYETMPKIQKNIVKTTSVSSRENSDLHISRSQLFIKRTKSKVIFK